MYAIVRSVLQSSRRSAPAVAVLMALAGSATAEDAEPIAAKHQFGYVLAPAKLEARAIGSYAKGCMAGGTMLPIDGPAWQAMRLSRNRNWGLPALVDFLERFASDLKAKESWPGLLIGDMSQPRGGPMLTGHASHQTGLDADIWYMSMPDKRLSWIEREFKEPVPLANLNDTRVIKANWNEGYYRVLKRAAAFPEVERILVHPAVKKALCDIAPKDDKAWLSKIRPMWGHNYHFHVRLACPKGAKGCVPQTPPPADDGCGRHLEDWLKLVSRPPKPAKPKPPPDLTKKPAKRKVTTVADLPKDCTGVLAWQAPALLASAAPALSEIPLPERRTTRMAAQP
ncbi:MAG: penicillin-insensitive murein endopeptidase [Hyphomicrobiaceae bacterium]